MSVVMGGAMCVRVCPHVQHPWPCRRSTVFCKSSFGSCFKPTNHILATIRCLPPVLTRQHKTMPMHRRVQWTLVFRQAYGSAVTPTTPRTQPTREVCPLHRRAAVPTDLHRATMRPRLPYSYTLPRRWLTYPRFLVRVHPSWRRVEWRLWCDWLLLRSLLMRTWRGQAPPAPPQHGPPTA